ncbi:hypothetical protein CEUSTIGMA_g303.t1 [Chlamydomonas eustigma]|uniref:ABC transporter domain-containing protein n=1 Tax=Chlamydomonas eustigma TaxID=1157962 RepID=A0A250WPU3_9CHLO|nr:hypothetical protein CEUSTIGMA_g303.t1 [Chlamydomonas eustigma]|eukprot:GAX72848.1 hypothetical protein CEUSTIGMA_g303.t1 [Chlamydomonas eustigma]
MKVGTSSYTKLQKKIGTRPSTMKLPATPSRLVRPMNANSKFFPVQIRPHVWTQAVLAPSPSSTSSPTITRGDTAGATMVVDDVWVQVGDRDLLEGVSWRVMPGNRVGLVGANGAGKSTLLRCLTGVRQVDAGRLVVAHKVEMGYLEQTAVSGSDRTVWEEARSRMTELLKAEEMLESAGKAMEQGDPMAGELLTQANDAYEAAGGPTADKKIANVLTGLGFSFAQYDKKCSEFSGGWQMRIALARLLLSPAGQSATSNGGGGLLLLDEPTNHLDSAAIRWLGSFLKASSGTFIIVSHDEQLLQEACDHIVEVRGKKLHQFTGSYKKFLEQRAERDAQLTAQAQAQADEIARLQVFVDRFGAKASKATQAQSRVKLIDKLKEQQVDVPVASSSAGPGDAKKVTLKLPRAPACHTEVIMVKGGEVGWGSRPSPDTAPLIGNIDLTVKRGQRILVLGPNGAGKSTLLKGLSGTLPLWGGSRKVGDGVKMSVFSQDLAQDLPLEKTALEYVEEMARKEDPGITLEKCRQALGALGLQNSMALQKIGVLSGGEKARVALAAFALVPCNVLLLDEASNHLDAATINVLTGALQDFQGAIVAITHNPAFAASLNATHILRVANGVATLSDKIGDLSDSDFEHTPIKVSTKKVGKGKASNTQSTTSAATSGNSKAVALSSSNGSNSSPSLPPSSATAATTKASSSAIATKKRTSLSWKEQEEYKKLSKEVAALTTKRDTLQALVSKMSAPGGNFKEVEKKSMELALLQDQLDSKELRWLELAEIVGDI